MSEFLYELPSEYDFLNALISLLEHNKHKKIAELLSKSTMSFVPTSTFTEKVWNTYWCSIVFSVPASELPNTNQSIINILMGVCSKLLPASSGYLIKEIDFIPEITPTIIAELPSLETLFTEQKDKIIKELKDARFVIWIAVAWFTLDEIYALLVDKQKEGLDVRIIISEHEFNKTMYNKYKEVLNIKEYPSFGTYNNSIMHNKFCVIDLTKVIHGSYNWSKKAEYNKETITIVEDKSVAEKFLEEFKQLYTSFD